jgi:eukaryotic-like serine/threonine-protein kinase
MRGTPVSLPPSNTLPGAHALQGSEHEAWIGRTLAGKYRIERVLGQGGMGTVFEAENLELQGKVAVKVLSATPSENRTKRFVQEAKAAARIGHPGVVQVFDIGEDHGMPFLVMERISGVSLATRLEHGRLELHVALSLMDQLLEVLGAAHDAGVIHRDVKPANIMILEGSGERLKLLDFGIAKLRERELDATKLTQTGAMMGTPWYMSPEQILQDETADHRADLWSATATFFEMLTGSRVHGEIGAFAALVRVATEPAPKLRSKLNSASKSLEAVVAKALELDREKRYPSASALRAAIALASEGRSRTPRALFSKRSLAVVLLALATGAAGVTLANRERAIRTRTPGAIRSVRDVAELRSLRENEKAPTPPLVSADASAKVVAAVPGLRCTGFQKVSKGHCCSNGLEWTGRQCDRPLAEKLGP